MLAEAVARGLVGDTQTEKDLFDGRIMNTLMPRPSEVIARFRKDYAQSAKLATDRYYALSIASNYIRKDRTDQNIRWKSRTRYGDMEITINLSKPEKDPKEIAKAGKSQVSRYPTCLLCKENVGFAGDWRRDGRLTHRIIPLCLSGDDYYLQYSPYVYYNEHCIVLNAQHVPMKIDRATLVHLLDFVRQFPHYMLGSNADLPIVGGSILSHDHYQGGCYHFPIQDAAVLETVALQNYPHLQVELLSWPLTTIRITSANVDEMVNYGAALLTFWRNYSHPDFDIVAYTDQTPHNTVTPIARRVGDLYQLDMVLRNNRTNAIYPDGIFHPHPSRHHIKKENIGLIEVMGLAVLPARLKDELARLKDCLLHRADFAAEPSLAKHQAWYERLKQLPLQEDNIDACLKEEVAKIFTQVLEDAGVFKLDSEKAQKAVIEVIKKAGGESI